MFSKEYEFDCDEDGERYQINVEIDVRPDRNYGADADGNRGWTMYFTEYELFEVVDKNGNKVTDEKIIDLAEKYFDKYCEQEAIDQAIEEYKDENY